MNHKAWLDNEYSLWAEALSTSTVHNFREHPQVKRMLGEIDPLPYCNRDVSLATTKHRAQLLKIQSIGYSRSKDEFTGAFIRMIYWALQVLEKNPKSMREIGGGVGEFYAILKILGYTDSYFIYDLGDVQEFQRRFLAEAQRLTGINMSFLITPKDFCISFYALGEFDDDLKQWYTESVVNKCKHGLIVWNPHSGASEEININHDIAVEDLQDGTKKITW